MCVCEGEKLFSEASGQPIRNKCGFGGFRGFVGLNRGELPAQKRLANVLSFFHLFLTLFVNLHHFLLFSIFLFLPTVAVFILYRMERPMKHILF
jgi:hypothetical protein